MRLRSHTARHDPLLDIEDEDARPALIAVSTLHEPGAPTTADVATTAVERPITAQFVMFCMVGIGNALVDATVYALLVGLLHWTGTVEATLASVIGFLAGATHSFLWNSRVTFRGRHHPSSSVAGRFLAVAIGGSLLAATASIIALTAWPFAGRLAIAKIAALGAAVAWNFSLSRAWVFRRHP